MRLSALLDEQPDLNLYRGVRVNCLVTVIFAILCFVIRHLHFGMVSCSSEGARSLYSQGAEIFREYFAIW